MLALRDSLAVDRDRFCRFFSAPRLAASFVTPVPALVFPMPFAGLRRACRFVFVAERYPTLAVGK